MAYESFGVAGFDTLHNQVVSMGGYYRNLDTTHAVGLSVMEHQVEVSATLEPPTVTETHTTFTVGHSGPREQRSVKTMSVEPDGNGLHVAVKLQSWDERPVGAGYAADDVPAPVEIRGLKRAQAIDRVKGGVAALLAREEEISDAGRR